MVIRRICKCNEYFFITNIDKPETECYWCHISKDMPESWKIENRKPNPPETTTYIEHPLTGQLIPENEFEDFNYWFPIVD